MWAIPCTINPNACRSLSWNRVPMSSIAAPCSIRSSTPEEVIAMASARYPCSTLSGCPSSSRDARWNQPVACADCNRSLHCSARCSATYAARRGFPSREYAAYARSSASMHSFGCAVHHAASASRSQVVTGERPGRSRRPRTRRTRPANRGSPTRSGRVRVSRYRSRSSSRDPHVPTPVPQAEPASRTAWRIVTGSLMPFNSKAPTSTSRNPRGSTSGTTSTPTKTWSGPAWEAIRAAMLTVRPK